MERHAGAQSATCREGGRPGPCSPPLPAALPHPHLGPDPMPLAAGPASVALPSGPPTKRPGAPLATYRHLRLLPTPDRPLCPVCRMPRCSLRTLPARHAPPPPSLRRLLQPRRPPPSSRPLLQPRRLHPSPPLLRHTPALPPHPTGPRLPPPRPRAGRAGRPVRRRRTRRARRDIRAVPPARQPREPLIGRAVVGRIEADPPVPVEHLDPGMRRTGRIGPS